MMFEFEYKDGYAELKRYLGTEPVVEVPEQTEGKQVRVIGAYAFAENRQLLKISLPDGLLKIDKHAFYNCRNLEQVSVAGGIESIEDGAFKNCEKFCKLILREAEPGGTCLKHLLYDQNHALRVTIHYRTGCTACLYFPSYEYEYIANEPARIFNEVGYGAGYLYQQCFFDKDVDYTRYDSVFSSAVVSEDMGIVAEIALLRLAYPYQLSSLAKKSYQTYLAENLTAVCMLFLKSDRQEGLHILACLGFFTEKSLPGLIEKAGEQRLFKGLAWLMDYQRKYVPIKQEEFLL